MNENIIFIHIPKTAGYTIGRCLRDIGVLKQGYGFSHQIARNINIIEIINFVIV